MPRHTDGITAITVKSATGQGSWRLHIASGGGTDFIVCIWNLLQCPLVAPSLGACGCVYVGHLGNIDCRCCIRCADRQPAPAGADAASHHLSSSDPSLDRCHRSDEYAGDESPSE